MEDHQPVPDNSTPTFRRAHSPFLATRDALRASISRRLQTLRESGARSGVSFSGIGLAGIQEGQNGSLQTGGVRNPLTNTEVASSVNLQMLLYFNVYFSICWFPATLISITKKKESDMIRFVLLLAWLIVEPSRLRMGYGGNLQEKVPFVIAFLLLTLFPQLPVSLYFTVVQQGVKPFDKALGVVTVLFLFSELYIGYRAMRQILRSQTLKYYLADYAEVRDTLQRGGSAAKYNLRQR